MISLKQAAIGYRGGTPLIREADLTAGKGEMVALVGRNGSGKSTLLRTILGLLPLLKGQCILGGIPLSRHDPTSRARTASYVSSQIFRYPSVTVRELASLGRMPHTGWMGRLGKSDRELVERAVREVGLEGYMDRNLDRLSDGERQRVMIARALVQDTPVILLDEPAAYLDIPHKYELTRILSGLREQGKTILYSTHDLETGMLCADKFWVILEGSAHEGSPEDLGLSGIFTRLFETPGIAFDTESGRFRYRREGRGRVRIEGEDRDLMTWTRHAMERMGFVLVVTGEDIRVEVSSDEKGYHWRVHRNREEEVFTTLYGVARFLTMDE